MRQLSNKIVIMKDKDSRSYAREQLSLAEEYFKEIYEAKKKYEDHIKKLTEKVDAYAEID